MQLVIQRTWSVYSVAGYHTFDGTCPWAEIGEGLPAMSVYDVRSWSPAQLIEPPQRSGGDA